MFTKEMDDSINQISKYDDVQYFHDMNIYT